MATVSISGSAAHKAPVCIDSAAAPAQHLRNAAGDPPVVTGGTSLVSRGSGADGCSNDPQYSEQIAPVSSRREGVFALNP